MPLRTTRKGMLLAILAAATMLGGCFPGQLDAPSERTLPVAEPEGAQTPTATAHGAPAPTPGAADGGALD
ncbi:MAG: hypothetical protein H6747_07115 [Deltaproteobacteria bacterium]|nr:hypothetical protein [Deltaproteobacteria bacterium]